MYVKDIIKNLMDNHIQALVNEKLSVITLNFEISINKLKNL